MVFFEGGRKLCSPSELQQLINHTHTKFHKIKFKEKKKIIDIEIDSSAPHFT